MKNVSRLFLFILLFTINTAYAAPASTAPAKDTTRSNVLYGAPPSVVIKTPAPTATVPQPERKGALRTPEEKGYWSPDLFTGGDHTCAVDVSGTLFCWGDNSFGKLGIGSFDAAKIPARVGTDSGWTKITGYASKTFGIRNGEIWAWGSDFANEPVKLTDLGGGWVDISAGQKLGGVLFYAAKNNGTLWRYEMGNSGTKWEQFGTDTDWVLIKAYKDSVCAQKRDKTLWCWGSNDHGQIGNGSDTVVKDPYFVNIGKVSSYAVGWGHTCAVKEDNGALYCWGRNDYGQLGKGAPVGHLYPERTDTITDVREVFAGGFHTCAIKNDGSMWCWGCNKYGQLARPTIDACWNDTDRTSCACNANKVTPYRVGSDNDWEEVSIGSFYTCAVKENGMLFCVGDNKDGQLGAGEYLFEYSPIEVERPNYPHTAVPGH